jgi:hypothetical protein
MSRYRTSRTPVRVSDLRSLHRRPFRLGLLCQWEASVAIRWRYSRIRRSNAVVVPLQRYALHPLCRDGALVSLAIGSSLDSGRVGAFATIQYILDDG